MRTLWIVALITLSASGQHTEKPTFSSTSNLVIVDVPVRDKSGKAIDGLKPGDFTLLEDGKLQKIQVFEHQKLSLDPAPPEPPPSLGDQNALPEAPKTTFTAATPGQTTARASEARMAKTNRDRFMASPPAGIPRNHACPRGRPG